MSLVYSHANELRSLRASRSPGRGLAWRQQIKRLRVIARQAIRRLGIALQGTAEEISDFSGDAAKMPQRPLVLGDKWDF
jgi:hypothetical protein